MQETVIKPIFSDLSSEDLQNHIDTLSNILAKDPDVILDNFLFQIERVDYEKKAFPEIEEKRKRISELYKTALNSDGSANQTDAGIAAAEEMKRLTKEVEKMKLSLKHYIVYTVEEIQEKAIQNGWGLCRSNEVFYLFNGCFWDEVSKDLIQDFLAKAAKKMGVNDIDAKYYDFQERLYKQFHRNSFLPEPKPNPSVVLINLLNGTLTIKTNGEVELKPFDKNDFLKYQLQFPYNPKAEAPLFTKFINRVQPDKDAQKILSEYFGYVFIKNGSNTIKEEKVLFLYGTGSNGKSVVNEVFTALFGNVNVTNYGMQSLTEEKGFYRSMIEYKLVNYATEINGKMDTSKFKTLASGEPIEVCKKYGQPYIMREYAKLIFNCNELPKDVEHTHGFFRRFLIIPFEETIKPEEQDKELSYKITEKELPGVLNWVLAGLDRLLKNKKFSRCEAAENAVEAYKVESDSVQMFLNENEYQPDAENTIPFTDLFNEYRTYSVGNGFVPGSSRTFSNRLKLAGFQSVRRNYGNVIFAKSVRSV